MNIPVTIPDAAAPAWQSALARYNAQAIHSLTLEEYVNDIIVGAATDSNVATYTAEQMQKLVPLGQKYLAAPPAVQATIDKELSPYAA